MRNDALQLVLFVLVLVLGAGCEELLPRFWGVGFPVLLSAVAFFSVRGRLTAALLFAIAAGAVEDSISALPPMTSVTYFLLVAAVMRQSEILRPVGCLAWPGYQLWLAVWSGGLNVYTRILVAIPIGLLTAFAVAGILSGTMRKAALDECV